MPVPEEALPEIRAQLAKLHIADIEGIQPVSA
jgi:hypothetical protein